MPARSPEAIARKKRRKRERRKERYRDDPVYRARINRRKAERRRKRNRIDPFFRAKCKEYQKTWQLETHPIEYVERHLFKHEKRRAKAAKAAKVLIERKEISLQKKLLSLARTRIRDRRRRANHRAVINALIELGWIDVERRHIGVWFWQHRNPSAIILPPSCKKRPARTKREQSERAIINAMRESGLLNGYEVVMGALAALPSDKARARVMTFVSDAISERAP